MKSLDVIASVDYGYRTIWAERQYLLRLAAIPLIVKVISLMALLALGWEQNYLRSALVMVPASFAEGWMLCHLVRLVFLGQRWPFQQTGNPLADEDNLRDRMYGITAGTLFYALIKLVQSGFLALASFMQASAGLIPQGAQVSAAEPQPGMALLAMLLLILTLWSFRFMFLYIPAAAGTSFKVLTASRRSMIVSLQILGIWLVSVVPCLMILVVVMSGVLPAERADITPLQQGIFVVIQTFADTVMGLVSTAAIAFGLRNMIENRDINR